MIKELDYFYITIISFFGALKFLSPFTCIVWTYHAEIVYFRCKQCSESK